jgi:serine protease AprX
MGSEFRLRRVLLVLGITLGIPVLVLAVFFLRAWCSDSPFLTRRVEVVKPFADVRWCDLSHLDLRSRAGLVATLQFNQYTTWPLPPQMPEGTDGRTLMTKAMNPGLGVRELHRQGITGRGVNVAIIDYYTFADHPEFAGKFAGFLDLSQADREPQVDRQQGFVEGTLRKWAGRRASMHGPAVTSLLVGEQCGTAPGARVYFVAAPDPGGDARWQARGLDWILEQNRELPPTQKIRVVSVSASPSGKNFDPTRNGHLWDEAVLRSEAAGVLVVDATLHHGFVGPCNLDPDAPEDVTHCTPVTAKGMTNFYVGRLLAPVGPRTTAEEYRKGRFGYQFTGLHGQTFWQHGSSWAMPYVCGVLALGWQVDPSATPQRMKELLFASAHVLPHGEKIIHPRAFVDLVTQEKERRSPPTP